jgi:hypothetical protein
MTNLFLSATDMTAATPSGAEATRWQLAGSAGPVSGARVCNKNGVAAPPAPLLVTDSQIAGTDGAVIGWYSDPVAAVTIAGTITASLWGQESATSANSAPCIGVYRCDPSGAVISAIVNPATAGSQGALEFTTTAAAKTCTITAGVTSTALAAGDRLKVTLCIDSAVNQGGAGSMSSSQNSQLTVNAPTGGAGQSQIAFTETIVSIVLTGFTAVAGRQVNPVQQVPVILSGG